MPNDQFLGLNPNVKTQMSNQIQSSNVKSESTKWVSRNDSRAVIERFANSFWILDFRLN